MSSVADKAFVAVTTGVYELPGKFSPVFTIDVLVLDESGSFLFCYNFSALIPIELWFRPKIFWSGMLSEFSSWPFFSF